MIIWAGKNFSGLNAYTNCGDWHVVDKETNEEIWNVIWVDDYKQEYIQRISGVESLKSGNFRLEYQGPFVFPKVANSGCFSPE